MNIAGFSHFDGGGGSRKFRGDGKHLWGEEAIDRVHSASEQAAAGVWEHSCQLFGECKIYFLGGAPYKIRLWPK